MHRRLLLASFLALISACGDAIKRPETGVKLSGTVYLGGFDQRGDPLADAELVVTKVGESSPLASTTTPDGGSYLLSFEAEANTRVQISVRHAGTVPLYRTLTVGPRADVSLSMGLEPLEAFECTDGRCLAPSDELSLADVDPTLTGWGRAFDAPIDLATFTGLETARPLAIGYFELDAGPPLDGGEEENPGEEDGGEVFPEEDGGVLPDDAGTGPFDAGTLLPVLRLRVALSQWSRLEDAMPGTDRIDVPLQHFMPQSAGWQRQAFGWLETENGLVLPENTLPTVRSGNWPGGVVVVGAVPTAGFWAYTPAPAQPGCITGTIEAEGQKGEGAAVAFAGLEISTAQADGTFCASAPVAADGAKATPFVSYAGATFDVGQLALPSQVGTCGTPSSCASVGTLKIGTTAAAKIDTCQLSGRALDAAGNPLGGAVVQAFDESVPGQTFNNLCGKLGTRCTLSFTTDTNGEYSLLTPLFRGITLTGLAVVEQAGIIESYRAGATRLSSCPSEKLDLRLDRGRDKVEVVITLAGNTIRWSPARSAAAVQVFDADGLVKWEVVSGQGLPNPFSYGLLPPGAKQLTPANGSPPPLAPGDQVSLVLDGTAPDGYQYTGTGVATVP